jgi:signal transduction histidine kinase
MKSVAKHGRNTFVFKDHNQQFHDQLVEFDEQLARIAVENAVTNAVAHGIEGGQIELGAYFIQGMQR